MVMRKPRQNKEKCTMSVAHKAPTTMRELSQDDLQSNFAVMVNNAITEGREAQVTQLVAEFQATQVVLPRKTVVERIREFLA